MEVSCWSGLISARLDNPCRTHDWHCLDTWGANKEDIEIQPHGVPSWFMPIQFYAYGSRRHCLFESLFGCSKWTCWSISEDDMNVAQLRKQLIEARFDCWFRRANEHDKNWMWLVKLLLSTPKKITAQGFSSQALFCISGYTIVGHQSDAEGASWLWVCHLHIAWLMIKMHCDFWSRVKHCAGYGTWYGEM